MWSIIDDKYQLSSHSIYYLGLRMGVGMGEFYRLELSVFYSVSDICFWLPNWYLLSGWGLSCIY